MKLTVFGASGRIGTEIVRQALAAGHHVTAVVRDPARFDVTGDGLEVFASPTLDDSESLSVAVAGRDAVLSGLGPRRRSDSLITSPLTRSVVGAMELAGVRRLLVVSAAPVGPEPDGETFLLRRIGTPLIKAILRELYADLALMESELAASRTLWTSVRPPRLTNRSLTGTYRTAIDANLRGGATIGRADVAHAMLAMIEDPAVIGHAVGVAY